MVMLLTYLLLALHLAQCLSVSAHPIPPSIKLNKRELVDDVGLSSGHWLKRRMLGEERGMSLQLRGH
jgi:hypothetical protein